MECNNENDLLYASLTRREGQKPRDRGDMFSVKMIAKSAIVTFDPVQLFGL